MNILPRLNFFSGKNRALAEIDLMRQRASSKMPYLRSELPYFSLESIRDTISELTEDFQKANRLASRYNLHNYPDYQAYLQIRDQALKNARNRLMILEETQNDI